MSTVSTSEAEPTGSVRSSSAEQLAGGPLCGTCPHSRAEHPDADAGYGCIGNRNFCNCPKFTNGFIEMCRCGHRRSHHGYGPEDSVEVPGLPTGACLVDETGKDRCECKGFMTPLAAAVAELEGVKPEGCLSCVDSMYDCTCGEANETCKECGHWTSEHGDAGCGTRDYECGCMVGALVRAPEVEEPDGDGALDGFAEDDGESPPPVLIEYGVTGGETFVIAVPRGVTAVTIDGMLQLHHHDKAVLGIVRVQN